MLHCGLLGEKLGHSYSPAIHRELGDYEYLLYEKAPDEVESFIKSGGIDALNVTIPYKKTVVPFLDELSPAAKALGSVNTIVRRADGTLFGDNTDYYGFAAMVKKSGCDVSGKKALVLGSGGASVTVCAVLREMGAKEVVVISRSGPDNYQNLQLHRDADIIVNTTPVGMYPKNGEKPLSLRNFLNLCCCLDIVYNPRMTALLLEAEELGIKYAGGLYMLVAQAKRASELFTNSEIPDSEVDRIEALLQKSMQNIVVVGMPGCGKSTVAKALAEALGRPLFDSDQRVAEMAGKAIPEIFASDGEPVFRELETEAIRELGKLSGAVIATGGGAVLREENYPLLHQNGVILWLQRDIDKLPKDGRPISLQSDLCELYKAREPHYRRFADHIIDNNSALEDTIRSIMEVAS